MSNQHHNRNGPDTSLPAPIGAASAAETIARMDHLWKLSHTVFATHPILAAHYQSVLKTTAHLGQQPLAERIERRCCERCGVQRVPAQTCRIRIVRQRPKALRYVPRPLEQRPQRQLHRLHSAREFTMTCLLCGDRSLWGGATRAELDAVNTLKLQWQRRQQTKSKKRAAPTTEQPKETKVQRVKQNTVTANVKHANNANKPNGKGNTDRSNTTVQPSKNISSKQKAKTKKKHTLSRMLDAERQRQKTEDNNGISLSDFLMQL